ICTTSMSILASGNRNWSWARLAGEGQEWLLKNFRVWVDGKERTYEVKRGVPNYAGVFVWKVKFPSRKRVVITHTYDFEVGGYSSNGVFGAMYGVQEIPYILKTGALWNGKIGNGTISVDLGKDAILSDLEISPPGFSFRSGVITWAMANYKPSADIRVRIHGPDRYRLTDSYIYNQLGLYSLIKNEPLDRSEIMGKLFAIEDEVREKCPKGSTQILDANLSVIKLFEKRLLWLFRGKAEYERTLFQKLSAGSNADIGLAKRNVFVWGPESFSVDREKQTVSILDSVNNAIKVFANGKLALAVPLQKDVDDAQITRYGTMGGTNNSVGASDFAKDAAGNYYVLKPITEVVEEYRADNGYHFERALKTGLDTSGYRGRIFIVDTQVWVSAGETNSRVLLSKGAVQPLSSSTVSQVIPLPDGRSLQFQKPEPRQHDSIIRILDSQKKEAGKIFVDNSNWDNISFLNQDRFGRMYFLLWGASWTNRDRVYRFKSSGEMDLAVEVPMLYRPNLIQVDMEGNIYALIVGGLSNESWEYKPREPYKINLDADSVEIYKWEAKVPSNVSDWAKKVDIDQMSLNELRILRNEIFAKHGHVFESRDLRQHFASQDWYSPAAAGEMTPLSLEEKLLVDNILRREKALSRP
ncbi:MAG: YARHG domain-containing protein, partial [Elusimicrobiales bacterium]